MPIRRKGGKQLVMPRLRNRSFVYDINTPRRHRISVPGAMDVKPSGPPIPAQDFLFYYNADWTEGNRAPEIGQGVQLESNANAVLVPGQVASAVEVGFQPLLFQTEGNINLGIGTLGFWWRKSEWDSMLALPSMFRESGSGTTWRVLIVGPESGVAGDQPTLRFRWATTAEHIEVPPGAVGEWIFVEVAWDFANERTSMRFDGGAWSESTWTGLVQDIVGGQWTIGVHQIKEGYTDTFDQIFITDQYQSDIHKYRYSSRVVQPPAPEHPPIPDDGSILFYYSCDWLDVDRAPEIGAGVQSRGAGSSLIPGVVNQAIDGLSETVRFQSDQNVDPLLGTMGFWVYSEADKPNVYAFYSNSRFRLQIAANYSFNYASPWFNFATRNDYTDGWHFVQIAWDSANTRVAGRIDDGPWNEDIAPGYDMTVTAGIGAYLYWGDYTNVGETSPIDQVFIAPTYQADLWQYRLSTDVGGTPPPGARQVLLFGGDTTISFASGWLDASQAHKIEYRVRLDDNTINRDVWGTDDNLNFGRFRPADFRGGRGGTAITVNDPATAHQPGTVYTVTEDVNPPGTLTVSFSGLGTAPGAAVGATGQSLGGWEIGDRFGGDNWIGIIADFKVYNASGTLIHHWPIDDEVADGGEITDIVGGLHGTLVMGTGSWIDDPGGGEPPIEPPEPEPPEPIPVTMTFFLDPLTFLAQPNNGAFSYARDYQSYAYSGDNRFQTRNANTEEVDGFFLSGNTRTNRNAAGELISPIRTLDGRNFHEPLPVLQANTVYAQGQATHFESKYLVCSANGTTDDLSTLNLFGVEHGTVVTVGTAQFKVKGPFSDFLGVRLQPAANQLFPVGVVPAASDLIGDSVSGGTKASTMYTSRTVHLIQCISSGACAEQAATVASVPVGQYVVLFTVIEKPPVLPATLQKVAFEVNGQDVAEIVVDWTKDSRTWTFTPLNGFVEGTNLFPQLLPLQADIAALQVGVKNDTGSAWTSASVKIRYFAEPQGLYLHSGCAYAPVPMATFFPPVDSNIAMGAPVWTAPAAFSPVVSQTPAFTVVAYVELNRRDSAANFDQALIGHAENAQRAFLRTVSGGPGTFPLAAQPNATQSVSVAPADDGNGGFYMAARFDTENTTMSIGYRRLTDSTWTWSSGAWDGTWSDDSGKLVFGHGVRYGLRYRLCAMWNTVRTDQWFEDNFGQSLEQGRNFTDPPEPAPPPDTQLLFQDDTLLRTSVTLDSSTDHYITYEIAPAEDASTRDQFIWCSDDEWGTGKISRARLGANNQIRPTRQQNSGALVPTNLVVGELVHIEEFYDNTSATNGTVFIRKNGVLAGQANVGGGTVSSALSFGGRALLKGTGISFYGVLRNIKIFAGDGTPVAHWELKNITAEGQTVPDLVGSNDAVIELGGATTQLWDDSFVGQPDPPLSPTSTIVPDIIGLDQTAADAAILAAGLITGATGDEYNDAVASGLIFEQSPAPDTAVDFNTPVNYTVSLGVEPTLYQIRFENTRITRPISLDNSVQNWIEYDLRVDESGSVREQEIWASSDTFGSGRLSRIDLISDNDFRPMRGSDSGQRIVTGIVTGQWYRVREGLLLPPGVKPYVSIRLDDEELPDVSEVTAGAATNKTTDIILGGRDPKLFTGSIRNVKIYAINTSTGIGQLIHHYPMDEQITGVGQTIRDIVGTAPGTVTQWGQGSVEARDPALPEDAPPEGEPEPEPEPEPPPEPDPPPEPPPGEFILFFDDFESTPVNTKWRGSNGDVINDPTGGGRGKVMRLNWSPTNRRPMKPGKEVFALSRSAKVVTYEFEFYLSPEDAATWATMENAKWSGPGGGSGARTGCPKQDNLTATSCRMFHVKGTLRPYKYRHQHVSKQCGQYDGSGPALKAGWQTARLELDIGTRTRAGSYNWGIDGVMQGRKSWQWLINPDHGWDQLRLEFFINAKPGKEPPPRYMPMYISFFRVTTPEAP